MPNIFDQFDAQPQAPAAEPDGSNIFDQFDPPAPKPMTASGIAGDVAKGAYTGAVKGAAGLVGMVGDAQSAWDTVWDRAALGALHKGMDWTGYGPQAGSPERAQFDQAWNAASPGGVSDQALDKAGVGALSPDSLPTSAGIIKGYESVAGQLPTPQTTPGKYAESVAEFLPAVAGGPESVGKKLLYGAVAPGVASEAAGQYTQGTALEPYARMGGALLGTGAGAVAEESAKLAKRGFTGAVDYMSPATAGGQQTTAAKMLSGAIRDPEAVQKGLADANPELVPGSMPTTGQLTGDMGLLSAEKTAETANPVPFQERRAAQNQARVDALGAIQPGGAPEDLAIGLRNHLQALDDLETGKVGIATQQAQDAAGAIGGQQSADFYGRQLQGAVQPQIDAAQGDLTRAMGQIGGTGTPEQYGAAMRGAEQAAKDAARTQRSNLYQAIDPDGRLNIVATGPRQAAGQLVSNLPSMAAQPAGEEAAIIGQMRQMPDVVPFRDLQALDSRITAAMSAERRSAGETPTLARLSQLKGSVMDAISNGVANQVAYERHGIATGQLAPEGTVEARVNQWVSDYLQRQSEAGLAADSGRSGAGVGSGSSVGAGGRRANGAGSQGSRGAAGNSGVPPLTPNFDDQAAQRLNLAKQAHAEYARVYKDGPTALRLKTNGFAGQYRMIDSGVPATVFAPGAKGAEQLRSYLTASGNTPAARQAVENYAAMSLRRTAEQPDGTLDPKRFVAWRMQHADALREMPELLQRFNHINAASESLRSFRPFTTNAPSAIPEMFFHAGPSGAEGVRNLRSVVGDATAEATLGDYAASKLRSQAMRPDGTLDPNRVAQFVKAHGPALDALPGLADRFSTAAKASNAISEAAALRKRSIDEFQRDAVGKIIGTSEPADITRMVGGIFAQKSAVSQMKDLATKAARDPDAAQGLRKAVARYISDQFMSNSEAATSGTNKISANAFQTFVRKNAPVLSQVFKPEEVASMQAIADDITRANRSRDAINIPGQSATAQLQHRVAPAGHEQPSWLEAMFKGSFAAREIGEMLEGVPLVGHIAEHFALPAALGAAAVKHVVGGMRAAGMKKVQDLYESALLNPDVARELLKKVPPPRAPESASASLATRLARLAPFFGQMSAPSAATPQERAAGGRVEPTDAQKEAGNFKKDHIRFSGLDISIENRKGTLRSGVGRDGKRWSVTMPAHYGYIRRTEGADGEHVDCYVGPDSSVSRAYIIDQKDAETGRFDEHKIMLGFASPQAAVDTYLRCFSDGKGVQRLAQITEAPIGALKDWLRTAATKKPTKAYAA